MSEPTGPDRPTEAESERLAFLERLMSRSGNLDNYEPFPADVREYLELKAKAESAR